MRYLPTFLLSLVLCGLLANDSLAGVEKYINQPRDAIQWNLGVPDRSGENAGGFVEFESYFKAGLSLQYGDAGLVRSVHATVFTKGDRFNGRIFGIALGDTLEACVAAWGAPLYSTTTGFSAEVVSWHHNGYKLDLEIWNRDKTDRDNSAFGEFRKDTVKDITLSAWKEHSEKDATDALATDKRVAEKNTNPVRDESRERKLASALPGSWEVREQKDAEEIVSELTYSEKGSFCGFEMTVEEQADGTVKKNKVIIRGRWRIEGNDLFLFDYEADKPDFAPQGYMQRYRVVTVDKDEVVLSAYDDGALLYQKRKKGLSRQ
jgi:hypothetical protein